MKRRFTILSAALALLVSLAIPMGMRGQTRTNQTAFYGFETGDAGWTATTFVTNNTAVTAHGGSKYGATNGTSANVKYNTIVESPQSLTCYYTKTSTNTNAGSKFHIQVSSNNSTWTTVASGLGMDQVTKGTWYELTADLSSYSNVYVRVQYDGTSAVRALDDITLIYDDGNTPSTDPEITFTPTSITLDEVIVGNEVSATFSVAQANLASDITLSVDNGSLSPSSIAQGAATTTVTWTYTPTTAGAISATVTATSGTTTETLAISGTAVAPVEGYDVDFEYATEMYPNWTFDNMTTYQTGSITAHGGTYYGTTGGKATASITTTSTVANPGTLTCYVSKQSGNTTSSTWYIQVSEDGSDWTDVESHSATSMSQGSWVEFTADLSSYSNVYVRVYYSGSTAVRNIDDLTLTIRSSVADPTFSPVSGTTFGDEGLSVTISQADNEDIYYTLDGTEPTTSSTLYNGAISLTTTTTIKAIAYDGTNYSNVATATYTYVDPNAPGTVNNPYSVSQAIDNTPSSGTSDNVYIHGIVSRFHNNSIVGDGSNYRYYISDDGTTNTELLVFKGKGLNNVAFSNVNDLLVGDVVTIYGGLTTYNGTKEIAANNYIVSLVRPTPTVEAPSFSPVAGTYTETQNVTISCATTDANIYYTTDGTEPTSASTPYTSAIAVSTTTTIKAIAYVGNTASNVATATYHFCSANDPYTVTEALAFNEYPANGVYVHGIVSTAPTQNPTNDGELTYYISVDGTASNQLEVYKGLNLEQAAFSSKDDIQVGDIVTVYGNVVIYNSTKEFTQGNYLVSFERPAQQYTLTVNCSANVEIFTFIDPNEQGVEGATTQQVTSGTEVGISVSATTGYILTLMVDGTDVTSQLDNTGYYTFNMPTHDVTITATASAAPVVTTNTYTLATSIESGKTYIIVGKKDGDYYAMGKQNQNNRAAVQIISDGTTATATIGSEDDVFEFVIEGNATDGYTFYDGVTPGYLYAASSSSNYLRTQVENDNNGIWDITYSNEEECPSVVASGTNSRKVMQFNNSSVLFACYGSASQHAVYLFVKDETPVSETFTKTITAYTANDNGWYLIASPIGQVAPDDETKVTHMLENTYDLFSFDQTKESEWQNYKAHTEDFVLEPGIGYLYANSGDVTLTFTGSAFTTENGTYDVELVYSTANGDSFMHGWNLVGNPFAEEATVSRPYYTLDEETFEYAAVQEGQSIEAMEGIFVVATAEGQSVTFTSVSASQQQDGGKGSSLTLNITKDSKFVDRAIVGFGQGHALPKFQFDRNHTKVYIPQDGQDYAIVRSEEMGEMPVNFKAENNGTYSLSFSSRNAEFAYLHLIDNMTGKDIDLLQTQSYSFEARTTDYESRFKLVFATGDNSKDDNFAFFSNGSFVINNEGNATLQVIDVTGRIISSESVNGCTNVNVNAAPGVYMLRLVNGENVRVQKVVVK